MSDSWPFGDLEPLRYGLILADPPWRFRTWGEHNQQKSASKHYALMDMDALKALPVNQLATDNAALVMWGIWSMLPQAIDLMETWGFKFKTGGNWTKQSKTGKSWAFGTGYLFRGASEPFIVGTIGKPKIGDRSIRNLIVAPVREHSRKPDEAFDRVRRYCEGPYLELFSRESREGWATWGNQVGKFDEAAA